MKIYFAGSIRGGRDDADLYLQIIGHLKKYGEVLTEHVGDKNLALLGEDGVEDDYIHNRDLEWFLQSNVVVAEVTTPSLGVGYEIGRAVENQKRVLCLYRPQDGKRLSAMIAGSPDVTNAEYKTLDDAKKIIDDFFE
ncbi:MAG: nucleoside 2-deoxyribosyltransferase [Methanocellales archaeon]|nr:nucleoside 2-deoxyribosyltransferase [Methanocellales archaeon]